MLRHTPIGPLRRFWALGEERIILALALMRHLRKHINAQRLGLSTCKAGALQTELRPRVLMSINMLVQTRKNTDVWLILSVGIAQRQLSACLAGPTPTTNHVAALGTSDLRAMLRAPRQLFGGRLVDLIEKRSELESSLLESGFGLAAKNFGSQAGLTKEIR